jgi:hypothetical protein
VTHSKLLTNFRNGRGKLSYIIFIEVKRSSFVDLFRFGSGFGADARRKRHTADSGYGSEQPLDRRWSQEFGHEVLLSTFFDLRFCRPFIFYLLTRPPVLR